MKSLNGRGFVWKGGGGVFCSRRWLERCKLVVVSLLQVIKSSNTPYSANLALHGPGLIFK